LFAETLADIQCIWNNDNTLDYIIITYI